MENQSSPFAHMVFWKVFLFFAMFFAVGYISEARGSIGDIEEINTGGCLANRAPGTAACGGGVLAPQPPELLFWNFLSRQLEVSTGIIGGF